MADLCDRCQRGLFEPTVWASTFNPERFVEIRERENTETQDEETLHYSYEATLADLRRSRDDGCWFCSQLVATLDGDDGTAAWQATELLCISLRPEVPWRVYPPRIDKICLHIQREGYEVCPGLTLGISTQVGIGQNFFLHRYETSEANFNPLIAKEWLQTCLKDHEQCQVPKSRVSPRRLLHLLGSDSTMSLRLESDPPENAEFVFLSYRWGGEQKLVLSQISKHDLLRGIPLGSLPATLQDAAKVTRGLDIRYLWVDSLCIFQDSQTDLTNEIAKMESYIQQATLVLQPSLVTRIHDSFLNPCPREPDRGSSQYISDPKQTRYLKVEVVTRDGQPYPIILDRDTSWYYPSAEPINSRGWTLQERLLCSRVLIFPSVGGMIWQCETYEKIHGQIQYGFLSERDRGRAFSSRWSSSRNQPALSAKEINDAWLSLVDDYNKRDLTNPQDKLLAVSGLAKRFADNHGDILGKYCAGAWYNFLHVSLHWHTDWSGQPTPECPPLIKRAPSWSWANADRSMFWMKWGPIPHPHFRIDIIACEVDLVSPDFPLGGVTGARLQLEGVPIEVSYNLDGGVYELGHGDSANDSVLETRIGFAHLDFTETHFEPGTGIVLLPVSTADAILLRKLGEDETYVRIGNCSLIDFSRLFNEWRSRWARKSITIE